MIETVVIIKQTSNTLKSVIENAPEVGQKIAEGNKK